MVPSWSLKKSKISVRTRVRMCSIIDLALLTHAQRLALGLQGHHQAQVRQHDLVLVLGQHHRDIIATCTTGITIAAAVVAGTLILTGTLTLGSPSPSLGLLRQALNSSLGPLMSANELILGLKILSLKNKSPLKKVDFNRMCYSKLLKHDCSLFHTDLPIGIFI